MAKKTSGKVMKILAFAGGLALFLVAWRFPVPLPGTGKSTTLLSAVAVLLGTLVGWREGSIIAILYVLAVIMGLPPAIWGGHSGTAFFDGELNGLVLGLIPAAFLAGRIAPGSQSGYAKLFFAMLAGQLVYLACGLAWYLRFGPVQEALAVVVYPYLIPVAVKSAGAFVIAAVAARFMK